ncbi:MAG TPA: translation initiation factor IF-2 [Acidimicrobiales bacterium]
MAGKIRVHELAKELGLTNKEALDLAIALGIGVKSHSSSIEEAQADRVRRRAERDGLIRDQQPEEPKPAKKAAKSTKAPATTPAPAEPAPAPAPEAPAPPAPAPEPEPSPVEPVVEPVPVAVAPPPAPVAVTPPPAPVLAPELVIEPTPVAPLEPVARVEPEPSPAEHAVIKSTRVPTEVEPRVDRPVQPAARTGAPGRPPVAPPGRPPGARPTGPAGAPVPPPPGRGPLSPSGKPIPPPPGRAPLSPSGKPIPPPPGRGPAATRPSGPVGGRGPVGARPAGVGAGRPGGPRPGGFGGPSGRPGGPPGARPGGGPGGGGPGGGRPGGGPGGRPSSQRRAPRRSSRGRRRRNLEELQPQQMTSYSPTDAPVPEGTVVIERGATPQEYGPKLNRTAADVVRFLLQHGEMITATMPLTDEQIELFALELGADVLLVDPGQQQEMELQALFDDADDDDPDRQQPRPPVITVMGHVDHGKTLLLDRIRSANVVAAEAGGITQHIGAYQTVYDGRTITFIDTPGHEAFTKMRARGAEVTDIVVLVVAADDGVMPQTVEALNHAKAAEVPIVVAVNKIDRENADPQRVMTQLSEQGLVPETWGGDTITVEMSALQNLGIDDLLEQLLLVAEVEELSANPEGRAKGVVLEANLDVGRGPVATILVDKGTLKVGDPVVAGAAWGTVRALIDDRGQQTKQAGPSTPVQVLGLSSVPGAGDEFRVAPDLRTAKTVAEAREQRQRLAGQRADARVQRGVKLEDVFDQIQRGETATLNLVLKADVQGSLEALTEALRRLERDDVKLAFVHRAVGGITENDISLAATTNATIIGFGVRPDRKARELADAEQVEIRTYEIIYQVLEDIEKAMVGLLAPEFEEVVTGDAEVREIFRIPRVGAIAGCYVQSGVITRGSKVRFLREGVIIWKGAISSLKRFKEDAREVREGFECGIGLSDFQDLKQGDVIETFEEREVVRS